MLHTLSLVPGLKCVSVRSLAPWGRGGLCAVVLVWFFLVFGPVAAEAQVIPTSAVHGGFAADTQFCLQCHDVHQPPAPRYTRTGSFLRNEDEKAVCYTCHNGTAANSNIKDDFGDSETGVSTKTSVHPVPQGVLICGDCHTVHKRPEDLDGVDHSQEVLRLVRVVMPAWWGYWDRPRGVPTVTPSGEPTLHRWWGYLVRLDNALWVDREGGPTTGTQRRLSNPNEACGVCHGPRSTLRRGNQYTYFISTSHDLAVSGPASGTGIKCNACHAWHSSGIRPLLTASIAGSPVTGNDNSVCFSCHLLAAGSYGGEAFYSSISHGAATSSTKAATTWPGSGYEPRFCLNCHDPHGTSSTDYRRADKNALCLGCHDVVAPPANYSYQGSSAYSVTPHAGTANANTVWPYSEETGAAVGSGGATAGECINCHEAHGRNDGAGNPIPKLALRKEESLCFGGDPALGACHASTTGSSKGTNIYARFNGSTDLLAHHSLTDGEQQAAGSKVECVNCHDVHLDTATRPTVDPDSRFTTFAGEMNDPTLYPQAVLQPDPTRGKDSTIASEPGSADLNFGTVDVLVVGSLTTGSARQALLEFDVSSIPTTASVDQAVLWLYQSGAAGTSPLPLEVRQITSGWGEMTVTWNSAPTFSETALATLDTDAAVGWKSWDITFLIQGWVSGAVPNYGVALVAPAAEAQTADWHREFDSSDKALIPTSGFTVAPRPKLVVKTSSSPPKVFDSIGFCGRCHDNATPPEVTMPASVRIIAGRYADPDPTGDFHGAATAAAVQAELIGPYYQAQDALSCNDCHDSHGSPNVYGLKEVVNGKGGISIPTVDSTAGVQEFCTACHMFRDDRVGSCFSCHFHGANADLDSLTRF